MTSPTRDQIEALMKDADDRAVELFNAGQHDAAILSRGRSAGLLQALSLFPEGRGEQEADDFYAEDAQLLHETWKASFQRVSADLSAARLRIKALGEGLKPFVAIWEARGVVDRDPAWAPIYAERPDDQHAWGFNTADITWGDLRRAAALLSSAQGETKEGFEDLPELPCGSRDGAGLGATAALAPELGLALESHRETALIGEDHLENAVWEYLWFHDGGRTHHVGRRFKLATSEARKVIRRLEKDDRVERSARHSAVNDIYWIAKKPADGPKGQDGQLRDESNPPATPTLGEG